MSGRGREKGCVSVPWTTSEVKTLVELNDGRTYAQIAEAINERCWPGRHELRTAKAVRGYMSKHKIRSNHRGGGDLSHLVSFQAVELADAVVAAAGRLRDLGDDEGLHELLKSVAHLKGGAGRVAEALSALPEVPTGGGMAAAAAAETR